MVSISASAMDDAAAIKRAALDYIESQHTTNAAMMQRALHPDMKKRTYWQKDGAITVMESSYEGMIQLAESYNKSGTMFPKNPMKDIVILDMDANVATVKLTADDWIDYMHLMKVDGKWSIINVLWQFKDVSKHGIQAK